MDTVHECEPETVIIKKTRPQSARPTRINIPKNPENEDEITSLEVSKLHISQRVAQARIARGYTTRKDLARKLNISVDVIDSIESRRGLLDKQKLNIICQHLRIKTT